MLNFASYALSCSTISVFILDQEKKVMTDAQGNACLMTLGMQKINVLKMALR